MSIFAMSITSRLGLGLSVATVDLVVDSESHIDMVNSLKLLSVNSIPWVTVLNDNFFYNQSTLDNSVINPTNDVVLLSTMS